MPIVSSSFSSNRYNDFDDYEDFCGLECFPYVSLREHEEPTPVLIEPNKQPQAPSFFNRIFAMVKFQNRFKPQF